MHGWRERKRERWMMDGQREGDDGWMDKNQ